MAALLAPLVLLVFAVVLAIRGPKTSPLAGVSRGGLMTIAVFASALVFVVGLAFLWALAVYSCHGAYECPI